MSSIYSNPDYVAKLPKNSFPLYQPIQCTTVAGQLIPMFCSFLQPGEKISGSIEALTRTNELETPAMTDIDEFVDYFFVPAKKLYSIFGEWYFGIDDNPTALRPSVNAARVKYLPSISPARMYEFWKYQYERDYTPAAQAFAMNFDRRSTNLVRLLQHFRFDVFTLFDSSSTEAQRNRLWNIPLLPFLAYQAIYYDYYRDSNWQENDVEAYNIDDWLTTLSQDNISYARLLKIFELHHRRQNADYFNNVKPSPLQNATSMLNIDGVREAALLAVNDWLSPAGLSFGFNQKGEANTAVTMESPIPTDGVSNTLPIVGNDDPDFPLGYTSEGNITGFDTGRWNVSSGQAQSTDLVRYLRDAQSLGTEDSAAGTSSVIRHHHPVPSFSVVANGGTLPLTTINLKSALGTLKSAITSSGIRTMFALEKLAKITGRAGKHYDDQVLAHFGYHVPKGISNEVYYIGGQHGGIHIGEIISPSTTEGSIAGEMVGKGYGGIHEGKIDFTAPCHGFFMAIYSSAPRRSYTPVGSPKEYSQFERQDFVVPELMNLGMQPLFPIEFTTDDAPNFVDNLWQWRYSEHKTRVPMAIGGFARYSETDATLNGNHQDWTIQYPIYNRDNRASQSFYMSYQNLLVSQQSFNSIFTLQWQPYDGVDANDFHVARLWDRDPLFHDIKCNFFLTSYASTFGEPNID